MSDELVQKIKSNPKYQELVKRRTSFAIKLSAFVFIMYYAYILIIAFNPNLLATKLNENGVMTLAFPIGALIIVASILTTIIYVVKANGEFENLTEQIKKDIKDLL